MRQPERQSEKDIVENVPGILEEKGELSTSKLAEELEAKNVCSESTARSYLYGLREYLVEKEGVYSWKKVDDTPGEPSRYWRLK
jgi:hypothetical protein